MSDEVDYPEVRAALVRKYEAEAAKAAQEAAIVGLNLELQQINLNERRQHAAFQDAADIEHRTYRFSGPVDEDSVNSCTAYLTRWSRLKPESDMTVVINSPGGYVHSGMDLFDTILELRGRGHHMTGIGRGYVASMGSILLQAFDTRVMGPSCAMLIHEPSGGALGTLGEIVDTADWLTMTAERILDTYADRCASSGAEAPLTRAKLKAGWNRKNWWLKADSCLKGGLIDEIR